MKTTYKHLSVEERAVIQVSLEQGAGVRAIARTLDRDPATISRELARNGWRDPSRRPRRRGRPPVAGDYRAESAQQRAHTLTVMPRRDRKMVPGI